MNIHEKTTSHYERPVNDLQDLFAGPDADPQVRDGIRQRLDNARKVDLKTATIVIASWENRFAAAGGVRAVTQEYAKHLSFQNRSVRVITPLHAGLLTPPGTVKPPVAVLWVNFEEVNHRIEVYESEWAKVKWVYLYCQGFFAAEGGRDRTNPYLYEHDAREERLGRGSPRLVRDCLFYAAALPKVLSTLDMTDNIVFHLQDWETVGVALSVKEAILRKEITRAVCVLALHNPYDKGLNPADLKSPGWRLLSNLPEPTSTPSTFLGRMLPLLDAPPATVSREFAIDLLTDPLQTNHLADHLQDQFKKFGIKGVDNGPFETVKPPFSANAINDAKNGKPQAILSEKRNLWEIMKKTMGNYKPKERWGNVDFTALKDDVPVFMCVGRLDPGQKGFDVAARAIENLLIAGLNARFVLTPIVGDAPKPFVDDLQTLAATFPDQVIVYPIRMQKGYSETQAGCTFSLWPSMYEPFGAVSEFLLRGTPVIARSTGGLRQQVVNFDPKTKTGNGILYKTSDPTPGINEWRLLQQEANPMDRMNHSIYKDQVEQLADAVKTAVGIFKDPVAYGYLLSNVHDSVAGYSWNRAEKEYGALYDIATRPQH
ncbi:MAG: Glycogen synthase [Syntrophorhabdus sp. PtaU1.Bin050]|nr:MAG: Glycogen synthase [Syntrophorhabdus sp. PtaU1.Bin050]